MRHLSLLLGLILLVSLISCGKSPQEKAMDEFKETAEVIITNLDEQIQDAGVSPDSEVKLNMIKIDITLGHYLGENNFTYPADIGELALSPRFIGFPINPYTGDPMKHIEFGAEPFEGNFTYIPVEIDGRITGFYMVAYGSADIDGEDINGDGEPDHVIDKIEGGSVIDNPDAPPLDELL